MRHHQGGACLLALLLVSLSGCSRVPPWVTVAGDVVRVSAAAVLFWASLFAGLGCVCAVLAFFVLRALGGYRWGWRHARWFRLATLVLTLILLPPLFGAAGALQGAYVAAERVLTEVDAVSDLCAAAGSVGADVIAAVYVLSPQLTGVARSFDLEGLSLSELDGFRKGEWEVSVPELEARLAGMDDDVLDAVAARLDGEARGRVPALNHGLGSWVLTSSLRGLIVPALKGAAGRGAGRTGVPTLARSLLDGIADAARSDGAPETIGRRDLSTHLVRRWIVRPLLLAPLRGLIRAKQAVLWGVVAAVLLLPVLFFQAAHAIREGAIRRSAGVRAARSPDATDPRGGSGP